MNPRKLFQLEKGLMPMKAKLRFRSRGRAAFGWSMLVILAGPAFATLPAPTPEQQAASAKKGEDDKAQLQKEQEALTRSQDRVADHYRRDLIRQGKVPPTPTPVAQTAAKDLPKVTKVPPRSDGPHGGTTPSAEAHSAPAK
jgi:hypothetical protein